MGVMFQERALLFLKNIDLDASKSVGRHHCERDSVLVRRMEVQILFGNMVLEIVSTEGSAIIT